jgi:pimeloyl-ACP methyl ester carboxylesterase
MRIAIATTIVALFASTPVGQDLPPAPGTLVDVDGHKLHVNCTGSGSPTVILVSGASSFAIDWALVQPAVAKTSRVCSYDRAGYGWSEAAEYDMRGEDAVRSLRKALDTLGEHPSFVLVGQSMGGRFARLFARLYPSDVKAMVLVDAEQEDGLFFLVNGRPVPISSMSDEEFDAAWKPPTGPPPEAPEQQLQPAHLKLPRPLQPVRLELQRRFVRSMYSASVESMRKTMHSEHAALRCTSSPVVKSTRCTSCRSSSNREASTTARRTKRRSSRWSACARIASRSLSAIRRTRSICSGLTLSFRRLPRYPGDNHSRNGSREG